MSSRLSKRLVVSGFILLRDKIKEILDNEIAHVATYDTDFLGIKIEKERKNPVDKVDTTFINVSFESCNYSNQNVGGKSASNTFNIDIYTKSPSNDTLSGDTRSTVLVQKIGSAIIEIFSDPIYKKLEFDFITKNFNPTDTNINQKFDGFIGRHYVDSFTINDVGSQESENISMGRISYVIQTNEGETMLKGIALAMSRTEAIIDSINTLKYDKP